MKKSVDIYVDERNTRTGGDRDNPKHFQKIAEVDISKIVLSAVYSSQKYLNLREVITDCLGHREFSYGWLDGTIGILLYGKREEVLRTFVNSKHYMELDVEKREELVVAICVARKNKENIM
jgi:hypothetical protein